MTNDKTGGQAFPRAGAQTNAGWSRPTNGMTLRDWFAGQASERDIEQYLDFELCRITGDAIPLNTREQAKYLYADAMLAARGEVKQ